MEGMPFQGHVIQYPAVQGGPRAGHGQCAVRRGIGKGRRLVGPGVGGVADAVTVCIPEPEALVRPEFIAEGGADLLKIQPTGSGVVATTVAVLVRTGVGVLVVRLAAFAFATLVRLTVTATVGNRRRSRIGSRATAASTPASGEPRAEQRRQTECKQPGCAILDTHQGATTSISTGSSITNSPSVTSMPNEVSPVLALPVPNRYRLSGAW